MYEKYLIKDFDKQNWDCAHLAAEFCRDNFNINTEPLDTYSRQYKTEEAYNCLLDGFLKNDFVEVFDKNFKKGDIILNSPENGCAYTVVNEKTAITIRKILRISKIKDIKKHLRHRSIL